MKGEFKRLEGFKRSEELKKTGKESSGDRPWLCKLQYTLNYVVFGDDSYENNFSVNTVNIRTDTDSSVLVSIIFRLFKYYGRWWGTDNWTEFY